MPPDPTSRRHENGLELPIEELLRHTRPLPPRDATAIDDLIDEEAETFFEAIQR